MSSKKGQGSGGENGTGRPVKNERYRTVERFKLFDMDPERRYGKSMGSSWTTNAILTIVARCDLSRFVDRASIGAGKPKTGAAVIALQRLSIQAGKVAHQSRGDFEDMRVIRCSSESRTTGSSLFSYWLRVWRSIFPDQRQRLCDNHCSRPRTIFPGNSPVTFPGRLISRRFCHRNQNHFSRTRFPCAAW